MPCRYIDVLYIMNRYIISLALRFRSRCCFSSCLAFEGRARPAMPHSRKRAQPIGRKLYTHGRHYRNQYNTADPQANQVRVEKENNIK